MDFQISKIILWPKNPKHAIRTVVFERGQINVISGLSRTGKSAIIPIIDYCLGSGRCTIPTGVIREKTSWFGVVISTAEGEKLFARREPEQQQATDDMYLQESAQVVIPNVVTKNATRDSVKQRLDNLSMLTTLSFTAGDAGSDQQTEQDCPLCNTHLVAPPTKLGELLTSLSTLEEAASANALPPSFDRELERVSTAISEQVERLKGIRIRQAALTKQSQAARDRQYAQMRASRFLGHLEADLNVFDSIGQDGELSAEVAFLRERVRVLERVISEAEIGQRMRRALDSVNLFTGRLMPILDAETPNDPVSLSETELTLKVKRVGREDFLWEIGSGSNWLSYHVALTLGLHQFFLNLASCPVPNFIVYDQPSQVYFPQRLVDRKNAEPASEPEWRDEDEEAVRKVFIAMSQAVTAASGKFQVIVLDHAPKTVWGGIPRVHEVDEWRNGQALIPAEWMN